MGLLDGVNQQSYYTTTSNYGNYQFVTLDSVIAAFMAVYVGEGKLISKARRADVQFHAMRAFQELSYDVFRSVKAQEIEVPNTLRMILPQDYVNYVKITNVGDDGVEKVLYPTGKTSNPFAITQDGSGGYTFSDNALVEQTPSTTSSNFDTQEPFDTSTNVEDREFLFNDFGQRYGLDPQFAQSNGTFFIDYLRGQIHFGSNLAGKTVVLHYVSDGLGTDAEMVVHKFCEEAVYKHIAYAVVAAKANVPEYIVARLKKERFAETRKAKIRLSNIKIEEFTQILRGISKHIK
tara:strand:- start:9728 stop:10600 length:873 start_codon:yes stop_codon:yes gene_type:complete